MDYFQRLHKEETVLLKLSSDDVVEFIANGRDAARSRLGGRPILPILHVSHHSSTLDAVWNCPSHDDMPFSMVHTGR